MLFLRNEAWEDDLFQVLVPFSFKMAILTNFVFSSNIETYGKCGELIVNKMQKFHDRIESRTWVIQHDTSPMSTLTPHELAEMVCQIQMH